jgi:hypothetical protein
LAERVFGCSDDIDDTQAFREDVIACEHLHALTHTDCGCDSGGPATDEHSVWPVLALDESGIIATTTCDLMACPDMAAALAREHSSSSSTSCSEEEDY